MADIGVELNDSAYWQQRAEEARRAAGRVNDPVAQQALLEIARAYEAVADLAKTRPIIKS